MNCMRCRICGYVVHVHKPDMKCLNVKSGTCTECYYLGRRTSLSRPEAFFPVSYSGEVEAPK